MTFWKLIDTLVSGVQCVQWCTCGGRGECYHWSPGNLSAAARPGHQDETVPVGEVAPAPAPGDLPLAELDHVVLVGHAGFQGAGEGC